MDNLNNKNILLCVTGSIAAYKSCEFIRLLRKQGCRVQVAMSSSSKNFIGELSLASLSDNSVMTDTNQSGLEHVNVAIEYDAVVVLPATANIICKASNGIADDIVSTILSICEQPKLFVPAMNFRMWQSSATQKAVNILRDNNATVMTPEEGQLASLHEGEGRLPALHTAMNELRSILSIQTPLKDKKVLITAGPTRESMDPVRYISNKSSGKMGYALAEAARDMGADVKLISGPVSLGPPPEIETINVETAKEMENSVNQNLDVDIIIMCAAVSDYTPKQISKTKIKSTESEMSIIMMPTTDIIRSISDKTNALIVAFALETCHGKENAMKKLMDKGADFIVLNHPEDDGCGIGSNFNKVTIYDDKDQEFNISKDRKDRVARKILEIIVNK